LGGANVAATGWAEGKMYASNGGGTRTESLDDKGRAVLSSVSMLKNHKEFCPFLEKYLAHLTNQPVNGRKIIEKFCRIFFQNPDCTSGKVKKIMQK